jgi:aldehyde:ferredoxin oxidoreductase
MSNDGYAGSILSINLTDQTIDKMPFPDEWKRRYIGGRGLGVAIVSEMVNPKVDPFSPENVLVLATGPLTGSSIPLGARYDVVTKSPLTGTLTSANSGGLFGTELKRAGFDAIVFSGAAASPVYLQVHNGEAELRDAGLFWGMTTKETTAAIQNELKDSHIRVATIGPAGERLCRMACIINEGGRAAGRGGVGAVMGAKHLKAITARGEDRMTFSDPKRLAAAKKEIRKKLTEGGLTSGGLPTHGTASILNTTNKKGILPTRNYQQGRFEGAEKVSGKRMTDTILQRRNPCYACIVGCGRITAVGDLEGEGPEYETIWALGPDCGVDDLEAIAEANYLCNDLGLDTISTGSTIACAMEMSEKGYISDEIRFGDSEAVQRLVSMIGERKGIGDELAEGSYRFSEKYGHPELSMSVKKQELPAYDPRGLQGMGLNYATSVRGGCHVYGNMIYPEILGSPFKMDPSTNEGKAEMTKTMQDLAAVIDSSGICIFTEKLLWTPDYASIINAVTGFNLDEKELMLIGERIWNLQKIFNIKADLSRVDDNLPQRLREEPLSEGEYAGKLWQREPLLGEYYALREWDENGIPRDEKIKELGIDTYILNRETSF